LIPMFILNDGRGGAFCALCKMLRLSWFHTKVEHSQKTRMRDPYKGTEADGGCFLV
jgi:hypothetical protein